MRVYSEQVEYPNNSQHPEHNKSAQEEKRKYRKQVNYTVKGAQEPQPRSRSAFIGIKKIRCPYAKHVFNAKDHYRHSFNDLEYGKNFLKLIKSFKKDRENVQNNYSNYKIIKRPAYKVITVAYLYDIKNAFPQ